MSLFSGGLNHAMHPGESSHIKQGWLRFRHAMPPDEPCEMQKCRAPSLQPWQLIFPVQDERGPKTCADVILLLAQCIFRLECMSLVNESQEQDAGMFQCLEERASTYHFYVDIFCHFHEFSRPNSLGRLLFLAVFHIFTLTWQSPFQLGYSNRSNIELQGET